MPINSKEDLFALCEREYEEVEIPGYEETFRIRSVSAAERKVAIGKISAGDIIDDPVGFQIRLVAKSLVDEHGERLFTDNEKLQIAQLPAKVIDALFMAAKKLNDFNPGELREDLEQTRS